MKQIRVDGKNNGFFQRMPQLQKKETSSLRGIRKRRLRKSHIKQVKKDQANGLEWSKVRRKRPGYKLFLKSLQELK